MQALEQAGTVVCEPVLRVRLEIPTAAVGAVLAVLARLGGVAQAPSLEGELATIETVLPAARVQDLQRQLPALTGGEGVLETDFGGYQPVTERRRPGAGRRRTRSTARSTCCTSPAVRGDLLARQEISAGSSSGFSSRSSSSRTTASK